MYRCTTMNRTNINHFFVSTFGHSSKESGQKKEIKFVHSCSLSMFLELKAPNISSPRLVTFFLYCYASAEFDIQRYAETYDVPRRQVSPVMREKIVVSRFSVKVHADLGETRLPIKPEQLLGTLGYQYNCHSSKEEIYYRRRIFI